MSREDKDSLKKKEKIKIVREKNLESRCHWLVLQAADI
jgi:hypothetical protein